VRDSQRSFGYDDFPVFMHGKRAFATLRVDLLKLLLVKIDDHHLGGSPEDMIIMLRHNLLIGGEVHPQRSRHLVFH